MSWIFFILVGLLALHQVKPSGMFELRLISFDNEAGKDDLGKCCTGKTKPNSDLCDGVCRPSFRVCLKEHLAKIDATSPCTFDDAITFEFEANPVNDDGFSNYIAFHFQFTWVKTFSLIIEAWHGNQTSDSAVLVSRFMARRFLDLGEKWKKDSHSSKYSKFTFEYRVTCNSHYYGTGCEKVCSTRFDDLGHYTCSSTGERVCLTGWIGDNCDKRFCLPGCDELHGYCSKPNECICLPGWEGPFCNRCERLAGCEHGSCVKPGDCLCDEGWNGLLCNQDLNFCTNHEPCRNGGTCFNTDQGSYACTCLDGFNGTDCEIRTDYCSRNPCLNGGTCMQLINDYKCKCAPGFTGKDCNEEIEECQVNPRQHDGTCANHVLGVERTCLAGELGRKCEEVSPSAAPNATVSFESNLTTEPNATVSSESNLTTGRVVVITVVPLVILGAVGTIFFLKHCTKREKARADEEDILQNKQDTANSSSATSVDPHLTKNSWLDDCNAFNINVNDFYGLPKPQQQVDDEWPVYSSQRRRSQNQLKTETLQLF